MRIRQCFRVSVVLKEGLFIFFGKLCTSAFWSGARIAQLVAEQ